VMFFFGRLCPSPWTLDTFLSSSSSLAPERGMEPRFTRRRRGSPFCPFPCWIIEYGRSISPFLPCDALLPKKRHPSSTLLPAFHSPFQRGRVPEIEQSCAFFSTFFHLQFSLPASLSLLHRNVGTNTSANSIKRVIFLFPPF